MAEVDRGHPMAKGCQRWAEAARNWLKSPRFDRFLELLERPSAVRLSWLAVSAWA